MQREERCKLNTMYFSWSEALDSRRSPQFLLSPCKGKFMVGYNFVITLRVSSHIEETPNEPYMDYF